MLYSGMVDASVEIFNFENQLKIIENGHIKNFDKASDKIIKVMQDFISENPKIKKALEIMHPENVEKQLSQFASCRLGGLDFKPDIQDGKIQDGEYLECANRGKCDFEGIV